MLPQKRLESLQSKKAILAKRIEDAEKCPFHGFLHIARLKTPKIGIK